MLPVLALLPAYGALCMVNPGYVVYFGRVVPVVLLAVLFCCLVGLTCSSFIANTARATVTAYLIVAGGVRAAAVRVVRGGRATVRARGGGDRVRQPARRRAQRAARRVGRRARLYALHLWTIGGACAAMLVVSWVRLNVLLRQG